MEEGGKQRGGGWGFSKREKGKGKERGGGIEKVVLEVEDWKIEC